MAKKKTSLSKKIGSGIATSILAPDSLSGFEATRGFLGALLGFKDICRAPADRKSTRLNSSHRT